LQKAALGWFHCRSVKKPNRRANGGRLGWGHPGAALFRTASVTGWTAVLRGAERRPPVVAPPAVPDENAAVRAKRLDALFAGLESTKVEEEHDVAEIWRLWLQSGNAEVDAQMQHVVLLMGSAPEMAMPILDDIVARLPDWAEGWNKRATVLYLIGEYDRSLADCDRVLALEPRHFGALAGIGLIHIQKDEPREALAAFRKALAVNPFLKERFSLIPELERLVGERPL
jgi:tetratricopeptide (TPR) repeat protein